MSYTFFSILLCPGSLAPPLLKSDDTMDLIFATHWIYPAKVPILQPLDVECVKREVESMAAASGYTYDNVIFGWL